MNSELVFLRTFDVAIIIGHSKESQLTTAKLMKDLDELGKKDLKAAEEKYKIYETQGLLGGAPRVMLGKSRSENNGLFLFFITKECQEPCFM